jgi:hypothetical protein
MWKGLMIVAYSAALLMLLLFTINYCIDGTHNWKLIAQAILWIVWGSICLVEYKDSKQ